MVPACSDGLKDEASFLEVLWVGAFPEFVGCESIAISWERLLDGLESVGGV